MSTALAATHTSPQTQHTQSLVVLLQEGGDTFTSGEYRGPSHQDKSSEEDLLAAEVVRTSGRDVETSQETAQFRSASGVK